MKEYKTEDPVWFIIIYIYLYGFAIQSFWLHRTSWIKMLLRFSELPQAHITHFSNIIIIIAIMSKKKRASISEVTSHASTKRNICTQFLIGIFSGGPFQTVFYFGLDAWAFCLVHCSAVGQPGRYTEGRDRNIFFNQKFKVEMKLGFAAWQHRARGSTGTHNRQR